MKTRLFMEMFAIVASYLIITTTVASAATIQVYVNNAPFGGTINLNPNSLVTRSVTANAGTLSFSVVNATSSVSVDGVWLYKCKDQNPQACMDSIFYPVEHFSGTVSKSYAWSEVSSGGKGNLLYFIKANKGGRVTWQAFWTVVTEVAPGSFTVAENEISQIQVHAVDVSMISAINQYISSYTMIPMNPQWVTKVVFTGATSVYEMSITGDGSLQDPSRPLARTIPGNVVSSTAGQYSFTLPVTTGVFSPVTLVQNPSFTCGMLGCEGPAETESNCCLDCGCGSYGTGYFCDGDAGCKLASAIGLNLFGTVTPRVTNCYESHEVSIPVMITNPPSSYEVTRTWCRSGGVYRQCGCTKSTGNVFVCDALVPAVPDCGTGEFVMSDNGIRFEVKFLDGGNQITKVIETAFPDITIGSFTCGMDGCESGIGEFEENCCYDCGCDSYGAGYFCDYLSGSEPSTGECRQDVNALDLVLRHLSPSHFNDHSTSGEEVYMEVQMNDRPQSLTIQDISCSMGCIRDVGQDCTSSCSVVWDESTGSGDPTANMSMNIGFSVSGYSPMSDYLLSPRVTFNLRYQDGAGVFVDKVITKTFSSVSIGAHWCGDSSCGSAESSSTCCFDCGCVAGQYCDTQSVSGPTDGDGCRDQNFQISVDSIGDLSFSDTSISHEVPVSLHVSSFPSGTQVVVECILADAEIPCKAQCTPVMGVNVLDYHMDCTLTIPFIDYIESPYYNPDTRVVTIPSNTLRTTLHYNNGYRVSSMVDNNDLGDIAIEVTSHCGEGSGDPFVMCETWLGEDEINCCRDCGCSDQGDGFVCFQGATPNGECVNADEIALMVAGTEPDPPECIIGRFGGNCTFVRTQVVNAQILNSPPDLAVLESFYSLDWRENETLNCIDTAIYGFWDCAMVPDDIELDWNLSDPDSTLGSDVTGEHIQNLNLFFEVGYELNNTNILDNLSTNSEFRTNRVKSTALASCENEVERIQRQIDNVIANQGDYDDYSWLYMLIGTVFIIMGIIYIAEYYTYALGIFYILMGALQIVLSTMGQDEGDDLDITISQLNDLIDERIAMCSSEDFETSSLLTHGMTPFSYI